MLGALALVIVLVAAGLLWFAARPAPLSVQVAVARAASQASSTGSVLDASGYVTARRQATVSAKITGKVAEVLIEEGMRVEEGDVLARLDDTEAQAQLALAQAQLAAARRRSAEIRAQLDAGRARLCAPAGAAPRGSSSARRPSKPRSPSATAPRAARQRRGADQGGAGVGRGGPGAARQHRDRAPFAGVVVAKAAQPGEMISPISAGGGFTRTGIGTIVDMDSLEIQVDVNESFINRVSPGQPVEAMLNAYPDWKIPGRGDRHRPDRRPQQGHRQGAHRDQVEGPAHRARHGRARGVPEPAAGAARAPRRRPACWCPLTRCAREGGKGSCSSTPTARSSAARSRRARASAASTRC